MHCLIFLWAFRIESWQHIVASSASSQICVDRNSLSLFYSLFLKNKWFILIAAFSVLIHNTVIWLTGQKGLGTATILDEHLKSIFENIKLVYLLEREGGWDANRNWEDILSLGEQQRLGMVSWNILVTLTMASFHLIYWDIFLDIDLLLTLFFSATRHVYFSISHGLEY